MNDYFLTHSGRKIYPSNISSADICLEDIAHHLTKVQRFGGALPLNVHYSVAEHSIRLAMYCLTYLDTDHARVALLHDATEAYLGDVISPLKKCLQRYQEIEDKLHVTIINKYSPLSLFTHRDYQEISDLDKRIMLDEARALMSNYQQYKDSCDLEPLGIWINAGREEETIKQEFLRMCEILGIRDDNSI